MTDAHNVTSLTELSLNNEQMTPKIYYKFESYIFPSYRPLAFEIFPLKLRLMIQMSMVINLA